MTTVAIDERALAWDLRSAWGTRRTVRLTMTDRCMIPTIVGRVERVAVTGAFAVVDGWHVPLVDVVAVGKPTREDSAAYRRRMDRLRIEADNATTREQTP